MRQGCNNGQDSPYSPKNQSLVATRTAETRSIPSTSPQHCMDTRTRTLIGFTILFVIVLIARPFDGLLDFDLSPAVWIAIGIAVFVVARGKGGCFARKCETDAT